MSSLNKIVELAKEYVPVRNTSVTQPTATEDGAFVTQRTLVVDVSDSDEN